MKGFSSAWTGLGLVACVLAAPIEARAAIEQQGYFGLQKIGAAAVPDLVLAGDTRCGLAVQSQNTAGSRRWHDPVPPPMSPSNMPAPGSALFLTAAAAEYAYSQGRGQDQQANPDYVARTALLIPDYLIASNGTQKSIDHPILHDPFVADWGSARGMILDTVISNRYGAKLNARLYGPRLPFTDPVTSEVSSGPFPAVIFIPGLCCDSPDSANDDFSAYEPSLERLAEHGYVVLAVSPQGQGGSEYFQSPSPYCDANGAWKQPQELGLTEQGPCAGQENPSVAFSGEYAALFNLLATAPPGVIAAFVAQTRLDPEAALARTMTTYDQFRPRFVFPAFDATSWLLSSANPWRTRVDGERLGIVGHSAGADAAVVAGNGDPARRFKAAIAWDTHGLPPDTVSPSIPTLLLRTELQGTVGPYTSPPHDEYFASYRIAQRFLAERKEVMALTLRGSNHNEVSYIPYALIDPLSTGPLGNVSSKGGQVSVYYSVAWLDRWLKGAKTSTRRGDEPRQIASARSRLLARVFDDSADRTPIGQGRYDPATQANAPYRINGERVSDHLTFFLLSQLSFDGVSCLDWQAGCGCGF